MLRSRFSNNDRHALFRSRPDRPLPGGSGRASFVGQVVSPASKIAVGKFLMVNPVSMYGPETEGMPGTSTIDSTQTIPVYLVGPDLAQTGDLLVCRRVDHRWVAERSQPASTLGDSIPGCPCTSIPGTLYLHAGTLVSAPEILVFPATFGRMAQPSELAVYNTDPIGYYSTEDFWSSDRYYHIRYWFGCTSGIYFLQGLMVPDSPIGYPGRFQVMTWLVGLPGNTCTPFSLTNGASTSPVYQAQNLSINGKGPPR
jgi:hypothetical protein